MAEVGESLDNLTSMVTSALEARGVLGKIRAELRASVFSAIHEHSDKKGSSPSVLHRDGAGLVAAQVMPLALC